MRTAGAWAFVHNIMQLTGSDCQLSTYNELHTLNLTNILRMIKSKRMRGTRDSAHIGQKRNAEYLKQRDCASDLGVDRKLYIYIY